MDEDDTFELFLEAVSSLARAEIPEDISRALMLGRITALAKPTGGVRGIAAGTTLRRLVARTLAKQYLADVEQVSPRSSTPYPQGQAQTASGTCFAWPLTPGPTARC